MLDKKPTVSDADLTSIFKSLLYKTDTDNSWSWLTDDAEGLIADFAENQNLLGIQLVGL